jgi:ribosome-binding factor A
MQKVSNRPRRVAELIKRELAMLIPRELDDPHAHEITITGAEVSRDMSSARIYFSLLAGSTEAKQVTKSLNRAAGFLRHLLMERVSLRSVPGLRFYFDESVERGARIDSLIDQAMSEEKRDRDVPSADPTTDKTHKE